MDVSAGVSAGVTQTIVDLSQAPCGRLILQQSASDIARVGFGEYVHARLCEKCC